MGNRSSELKDDHEGGSCSYNKQMIGGGVGIGGVGLKESLSSGSSSKGGRNRKQLTFSQSSFYNVNNCFKGLSTLWTNKH